jgi:hypothetical protein
MLDRILQTLAVVAVVALAVVLPGCGDDDGDEAPLLPPVASLALNVDFFLTDGPGAPVPLAKQNYLAAATRVVVIKGIFTLLAAPPASAFALAHDTVPSRDDDGSWWWIYTWRHDNRDHQIRLRGVNEDDGASWELYLKAPDAEPWLWYTGRTANGGRSGYWVFRDLADRSAQEVARIDWESGEGSEFFLNFSVLDPAAESFGDDIVYEIAGNDRAIEYVDASSGETWDITWNVADGTGSLRVPGYNGGDRACWDEDKEDTACLVPGPGGKGND